MLGIILIQKASQSILGLYFQSQANPKIMELGGDFISLKTM